MNIHTEIARITEELRALYLNDNDAPRLITEMLEREFPDPRGPRSSASGGPMTHSLG